MRCALVLTIAALVVAGCGGSSKPHEQKGKAPATKAASSGGVGTNGGELFSSNGCSGCHTLARANSTGTTGPNLDKQLPQDAKRAGKSLAAFTKQSIVDPNAYIAKGYQGNIMPQTFGQRLSASQIKALVTYVTGKTQ